MATTLVVMGVIASLAALDMTADLSEGIPIRHLVIEAILVLAAMAGAGWAAHRVLLDLRQARVARDEATELAQKLRDTEAEAIHWRAEASNLIAGMARALDRQFERWSLSPAEKEVALLLLKGLSHRDIAAARSITEATACQQARAVYKKAGLSGRNDLSAFFLEDLLLPSSKEEE